METNKINYITIQQYLDGKLEKGAMHELEKQALEDPFLADALEGYSLSNEPATKQLSLLQTQLQKRIAQQQENKNILSFSWQRLSIAAAACLLFVSATMLLWLKTNKAEQQLASAPKKVDVNLMPKDSLVTAFPGKKPPASAPQPTNGTNIERDESPQLAVLSPRVVPQQSADAVAEASSSPAMLNEVVVVGYGTQKKQIVTGSVSALSATSSEHKLIAGKVTDHTGEPLPGVQVRLLRNGTSTVTDSNGEFHLNDSLGGDIRLAYIGYNQKDVKSEPGTPVRVSLEENKRSLNEVVVVGYGTSKRTLKKPEPVIGWTNYLKYLKENVSLPKELSGNGKVKVEFTVNPDKQLSNFKIVKGLNPAANQEAIRLIKEGPEWQPGKQTLAEVTVEFE